MATVAGSPTGSKGSLIPTQNGWHLLTFGNGNIGVVNYQNGQWKWGATKEPDSPITGINFLGSTIADIENPGNTQAGKAFSQAGLDPKSIAAVVSSIDVGQLKLGHPFLFDPATDKTVGGTGKQSGGNSSGDANPVEGIPGANAAGSAVSGALSGLGFFTSSGFWKGIGLVLAGGLILVFAALEFYRLSGG